MTKETIAYLTGEYPKVSHTFIQREIAELRAQGWQIEACTIRRAPAQAVVGEVQKAEELNTFCVLEAARNPITLLRTHISLLKRDAKAWGRAAALAWQTRPAGLKAALWQAFYFLEAGVLAHYLLGKGVRHLHNHFANSSCSVAMLASEMSGITFSITMHGPAIFFEPYHWRIDEKIARSAFVSCISHFCRSQAMYFSDSSHWERLKIVHCGVRPEDFCKQGRVSRGKHIICVGRLDAVKGIALLIEGFAAIMERHPEARLSIVGDGPARSALETQADSLGLGDKIRFWGYRAAEEVPMLLDEADIFVLPSFAEGVPVVFMEAMAAQLPVIASRVAGVGELVEDGISGYTIPPGDVETLSARMDTLLSNAELCDRMGHAGRAQVDMDFNIEKEAAWLGDLFTSHLKGHLSDGLRPN